MTPEQARALLLLAASRSAGTPADGVDEAVTAEEKADALAAIAGMEWEYALQVLDGEGWKYICCSDGCVERLTEPMGEEVWWSTPEEANGASVWAYGHPTRIVRRLVSKPQVM